MRLEEYIKGHNNPIYLIVKKDKYMLCTDNFYRVFYFKDKELIRVENSNIIRELYNNMIHLENHSDDLDVKEKVNNNRLYKNFIKFIEEDNKNRKEIQEELL